MIFNRVKVIYDLFKTNPIVMYCKTCESTSLQILDEKTTDNEYSVKVKCKRCGSTADFYGKWIP